MSHVERSLHPFLFVLTSSLVLALPLSGQIRWKDCLEQKDEWYRGVEAIRIADNVLFYQFACGGWPKNIDMAQELTPPEKKEMRLDLTTEGPTIDNRATYIQLRYLAKVYNATHIDRFKTSFLNGFDYLIKAQYANGGWPQFYPLREGYYSHITFNDDAMAGVLNLLRDIGDDHSEFRFVEDHRKGQAQHAVAKGLECILKCQVTVSGTLTSWCAQHDEYSFQPAKARTYELPSLSGMESVGIVRFLMRVEHPSKDIVQSVQSAIGWFSKSELFGIRVVLQKDSSAPEGLNRVVVPDSTAPVMWARFYQIGTNRPFFCSRDGIMRDSLSQITIERRNHYVWLGSWPETLLEKEYPEWLKENHLDSVI